MKKFISIFSAALLSVALSSCSCAIFYESWQHEQKKPISTETIQRASTELDLHKSIHLGLSEDGLITLYSSLCPTPYTLFSGGSDIEAWNSRCEEAHSEVSKWFKQNNTPIIQVHPHP